MRALYRICAPVRRIFFGRAGWTPYARRLSMNASIRQAFVLGAGLGTRLKKLTHARPKPLIPLANRPLITWAFDHLRAAGIERFIVNTHHCAAEYARTFPSGEYGGCPLTFRHEPVLLETGGGMANIADLLGGEPFLVYNGDVLTDLPLAPALAHHREHGNEVTLILRTTGEPRQITFEPGAGRVLDIGRRVQPAQEPSALFTGLYLVEPAFLARLLPGKKRSVIPTFIEMIRSGAALGSIVINEGTWHDLGTREEYLAAHARLGAKAEGMLAASAEIAPEAELRGATAIGPRSRIGQGARLQDCVVWEDAVIEPGSALTRCIVTAGQRVSGVHSDADF